MDKKTMEQDNTKNMANSIVLLTGGARSGRTAFAVECGKHYGKVIYFGNARKVGDDSEIFERIAEHSAARPASWITLDPPTTIEELEKIAAYEKADAVIVDSLSLWLGHELTKAHNSYTKKQLMVHLDSEINFCIKTLGNLQCPVFVVSNEVGLGVVPDHQSGRVFRDFQGILNNKIAEKSLFVCFFLVGQALLIKDYRYTVGKQNSGYLPIATASPEWICKNLKK